MKRIQIAFAAILISTSIAVAQPSFKQDKRQHGPHKEMAYDKLDLTEAQKAKIKASDDDFRKQMQAIGSNDNQTVKQQRDAREALMKQHKAQRENILTAEQKAQLKQMKLEGKAEKSKMAGKHFDKMKQDLNLTDQQVSQLKNYQDARRSQFEAIQNNNNLDQTAKMQQLRALRDEQRKNMEQVLTPEQREKWQGMMKNKPHHFRNKKGGYQAAPAQS